MTLIPGQNPVHNNFQTSLSAESTLPGMPFHKPDLIGKADSVGGTGQFKVKQQLSVSRSAHAFRHLLACQQTGCSGQVFDIGGCIHNVQIS